MSANTWLKTITRILRAKVRKLRAKEETTICWESTTARSKESWRWQCLTIRRDNSTRPISKVRFISINSSRLKVLCFATQTLPIRTKLTRLHWKWDNSLKNPLPPKNPSQPLFVPPKTCKNFTKENSRCSQSMALSLMNKIDSGKYNNSKNFSFSKNKQTILRQTKLMRMRSTLTSLSLKKRGGKWQSSESLLLLCRYVRTRSHPKMYQRSQWARTSTR